MNSKPLNFKPEEITAVYRIIKDYEENIPEDDEAYNDYYDKHDEPIDKKLLRSILKKIIKQLPKEDKQEIDKDFLRKKYHSFNNNINERAYSVIEKAFEQFRTSRIASAKLADSHYKMPKNFDKNGY